MVSFRLNIQVSQKEKIAQDTERDYYLTSEEAKAYGLIDEVVTRKAAAEEAK